MSSKLTIKCPCSIDFEIWPYEQGRAKYCSKACKYKYRIRPFGLKYKVTTNKGWFEKGMVPYNLGTSTSKKTKLKISQKLKGIHTSPNTEFKKGQTSGASNVNWKGGITPENQKIRHSDEYKKWRKAVFERDDYTCQICGARGGKLNADHIKPFAKFPSLRFEVTNGRTLCVICHRTTDTFGIKSR